MSQPTHESPISQVHCEPSLNTLQFTAATFAEGIVVTEEIRSVAAGDFITDFDRTKDVDVSGAHTSGDELNPSREVRNGYAGNRRGVLTLQLARQS